MRKMKRTLVDYKPGIKPNKDNIVRLDNDYCIYVTACGKHNEVFSGHVSMSDQEDWVQQYGLEHVSTGPQSYFNNIDDIADALTNVVDASSGDVIDDNIKEGDIFGLKYGCIVIDKVITNKDNKVGSVTLTPINGTHKWPKVVITLRTLRTVIDDIVKAYIALPHTLALWQCLIEWDWLNWDATATRNPYCLTVTKSRKKIRRYQRCTWQYLMGVYPFLTESTCSH